MAFETKFLNITTQSVELNVCGSAYDNGAWLMECVCYGSALSIIICIKISKLASCVIISFYLVAMLVCYVPSRIS